MSKDTTTKSKSLSPLIKNWGGEPSSILSSDFSGLSYDSRKTKPNDIFFCIKGEHFDGNNFIEQVVKSGAALVVSEEKKPRANGCSNFVSVEDVRQAMAEAANYFYGDPSMKLRTLGVTGTNGKTSTTHIIEKILIKNGNNTGLIGTMGARWSEVGQAVQKIDLKHTTPQCIDFYEILNQMVASNVSHVAMEVSSHALAQKRVGLCNFAAACLTNITQDHLDFHKTMESYRQAKALLFSSLVESKQSNRNAVLNRDEEVFESFKNIVVKDSGINLVSYGFSKEADFRIKEQEFTGTHTRVVIETPDGSHELLLQLVGRFNLYNVLGAIALARLENIDMDVIAQAVETFKGVEGRFEVVTVNDSDKDYPLCIVDYAHTPDGLENVLKVARELVKGDGKLICVFGCGGDRDTSKRPQMGKIAEAIADRCVVTSDNPRSEDPMQIIADILAGLSRIQKAVVEEDREKAINLAVEEANDSDVIVFAGKGHETYQLVKDQVLDFDDRIKVREALIKRLS